MPVTQEQLKQHFLRLGDNGAIYVWGANGQIITKDLMDRLYKTYGSSRYNKQYYEDKLKEGEGKIGADCSGSLFPISGYDSTASGYYSKCIEKGNISTIPSNKVCLVFKQNNNKKVVHVGCYTGDGYVSEMASSALNYQRKPLTGNGWDLWGTPNFISDVDSTTSVTKEDKKASDTKMTQIKKGSTGKAVKVWQTILGVSVDGIFGNKTRNATITFQKKAFPNSSSEWDGIVGNKTWRAGLESV